MHKARPCYRTLESTVRCREHDRSEFICHERRNRLVNMRLISAGEDVLLSSKPDVRNALLRYLVDHNNTREAL